MNKIVKCLIVVMMLLGLVLTLPIFAEEIQDTEIKNTIDNFIIKTDGTTWYKRTGMTDEITYHKILDTELKTYGKSQLAGTHSLVDMNNDVHYWFRGEYNKPGRKVGEKFKRFHYAPYEMPDGTVIQEYSCFEDTEGNWFNIHGRPVQVEAPIMEIDGYIIYGDKTLKNNGITLLTDVIEISKNDDGIIYATRTNGEVWKIEPGKPPIQEEKQLLGDIDKDGTISAYDALLALEIVVEKIDPTPEQIKAGDVNKSGEIESMDALKILEYVTGKISEL